MTSAAERSILAVLLVALGCGDDTTASPTGGTTSTSDTVTATDTSVDTGSTADSADTSTDTAGPTEPPPDPASMVAAGQGYSCGLQPDGVLQCWGNNVYGQLGDGTRLSKALATVEHDVAWSSVTAGNAHACAIDVAGAMYCWGSNFDGQLGNGVTPEGIDSFFPTPEPIAADGDWISVDASASNSCAIRSDRSLWCWGENDDGQIGNGGIGGNWAPKVPDLVLGGGAWNTVATSSHHTCGIQTDGSLWCWGSKQEGSLGDGTDTGFTGEPIAIDADNQWVRVRVSGGLYDPATCAIKDDGSLWCWGSNSKGQLGLGDTNPRLSPTQVEPGTAWRDVAMGRTTCGVKMDGTLWCWGTNYDGVLGQDNAGSGQYSDVPVQVGTDTQWRTVTIGGQHACATRADDTQWCWGHNDDGEIGNATSGPDTRAFAPVQAKISGANSPETGFASVALAYGHGCAVRDDGSLRCWGINAAGQLGLSEVPVQCIDPDPGPCKRSTPQPVAAGQTWTSLALGNWHTCAVRQDQSLWCWGDNASSQLGAPTPPESFEPLQVGAATDWLGVAAAESSTCGIRAPGALWCWGANANGHLGTGEPGVIEPVPTQIGTEVDWSMIEMGYAHTCGIQSGALWCWGANSRGQLGLGTSGAGFGDDAADESTPRQVGTGTSWVEVALGRFHTCARRDDGTLWCWGASEHGALGEGAAVEGMAVPLPQQLSTAADWVEVAAAEVATCGRRADGTIWCWGSSSAGILGDGEDEGLAETPQQVGSNSDWTTIAAGGSRACAVESDGDAFCWGGGPLGNHTIWDIALPVQLVTP